MEGASQHTVFLIDDDEAIRAYLSVILRGEGFNVVGEAGSIDKAQKQLRSLKADVVFFRYQSSRRRRPHRTGQSQSRPSQDLLYHD